MYSLSIRAYGKRAGEVRQGKRINSCIAPVVDLVVWDDQGHTVVDIVAARLRRAGEYDISKRRVVLHPKKAGQKKTALAVAGEEITLACFSGLFPFEIAVGRDQAPA